MFEFVSWYLIIFILGLISFPITFFVFNKAHDKGYSISKIFGLVLWGFIYWIGNLSHLIRNNRSGAAWSLFVLIGISAFFLTRQQNKHVVQWIKTNIRICLWVELVFSFFCIFWTLIRAISPEILGTEKPMELAFINAINRSPAFPPNDPWLSGYAISYYYFGYILVVLFIKILGTSAGIAFNLAISTWIAMIASASFGIIFNLLNNRWRIRNKEDNTKSLNKLLLFSLLAPILIIFLSNAEGFLELIHSRGFFWEETNDGVLVSTFWQNLDIKELTGPPPLPLDWRVSHPSRVWWWRASRVLQDYTIDGQSREIIDEFPFFSFYLADLHPHVLVLPFLLLCVYFGMQFITHPNYLFKEKINLYELINNPKYWFLVISLGSIIFINIWDFPICFLLIISSELISFIKKSRNPKYVAKRIFQLSILLGFSCLLLYLPFLIAFSSQAGGLLPSLVFRTRTIHFVVMFLPQLLICLSFIAFFILPNIFRKKLLVYIGIGLGLSILLVFLSILFTLIIGDFAKSLSEAFPGGSESNIDAINQSFLSIYGAGNISELLQTTLYRRLTDSWVIVILVLMIGISLYIVSNDRFKKQDYSLDCQSTQFAFLLVILASIVCLFPEIFYLKDQFGWRMNTIFKFYYQAWIFFGLAAAFFVFSARQTKIWFYPAFLFISVIGVAIGLVYPFFALSEKFSNADFGMLSLDGYNYFKISNPAEFEAVEFLEKVPYGVISEAIGGSYSGYGRISMLTGLPTILGWTGHELQWRGGVEEMAGREADIRELYTTNEWDFASSVINRYQIDYIYIGDFERKTYKISLDKFRNNLPSIFNNGEIEIFSVKELN